jgi:hypothetical protein
MTLTDTGPLVALQMSMIHTMRPVPPLRNVCRLVPC